MKFNSFNISIDKQFKCILLAFLFCFLSGTSFAQFSATATVDRDTIKIGEQFNLKIESQSPEEAEIEWPKLLEKVGDFEIVGFTGVDTQIKDGTAYKSQNIRLTIFEDGYKTIPGIVFKSRLKNRNSQFQTDGKLMTVLTLEVDTTKSIMPIKEIIEVPMTWKEIIYKVVKYVSIALIAFLILFFAYRYFNRKEEIYTPPPPPVPAHEIALSKLKNIEKSKLWEQGSVKNYYSEVTDTLREYVEKRFEVPALESTTEEIVEGLSETQINPALTKKLTGLLEMADLVKFAKAKPGIDSHKSILKDAFVFVQHSKNAIEIKEEEQS